LLHQDVVDVTVELHGRGKADGIAQAENTAGAAATNQALPRGPLRQRPGFRSSALMPSSATRFAEMPAAGTQEGDQHQKGKPSLYWHQI